MKIEIRLIFKSMTTKSKHIAQQKAGRFLPLVACFVFIFAQISTFQHEFEHASHDDQASCEAFIAYSASSVDCDAVAIPEAFTYSHFYGHKKTIANTFYIALDSHPIRAPPVNTLS